MIPLVDLKRQYVAIKEELDAAYFEVVTNTAFIKGERLQKFETHFADYCGSRHAVGASSGTSAIHLALAALDIGAGDEVIIPSHTFFATAEPVIHVGATPIFCDIDPRTYLIDTEMIQTLITDQTKAIIPVHLYGQMAPMDELLKIASDRGIHIIEDCAQAHGAEQYHHKAGSSGVAGCFSFFPGKNLGAYGDGGAVTCQDEELADRIAKLADHGRATKYTHDIVGYNYRLDALQATILSVKLRYIEEWTKCRRSRAELYDELLSDIEGVTIPFVPDHNFHVYHLYVIAHDRRDELREYLSTQGISAGIHYPVPLHLQPALSNHLPTASLAHTERAASRILSLPMFPELEDQEVERICKVVKDFCERT